MIVFLSKLGVIARNAMTFWQLPKMEKLVFEQWVNPKNRVLILEYGSRRNIEKIAKLGCQVTLASLSEGRLLNAKKRLAKYKNVEFQRVDSYLNMPFKESSFDSVVLELVSQKFSAKNITTFVRQVRKITKNGGLIIHMGEGNPAPVVRAILFLPRLLFLLLSLSPVHFHHDLNKIFRSAGAQVVYRKPFFINDEVIVGKC